jgi:hypothetical protein
MIKQGFLKNIGVDEKSILAHLGMDFSSLGTI